MKHALSLPIFGELADPAVVAAIAAEAEQAGWDGLFVWDHLAYGEPVRDIADPWITLAAVACATQHLRIGPMVTPLPRRRPVKVAREVATLDRLSAGRVTLGVGIGGDGAGEFSGTGEQVDARVRGRMLDEGLTVLQAAWSGEPVHHRGDHYVLDGLAIRPTPVQRPSPPVWIALRRGNRAPLQRAVRHDGMFPIQIESADQLAEVVAQARALRPAAGKSFDVAVGGPAGSDTAAYAAAGATWWMASFSPYDVSRAKVAAVAREGPG